MNRIKHYLFAPRFTFNRIQFNILAIFFITIGLISGTYLTLSNIIPNIFASSTWTQTDWSGGSASGTITSTATTYSAISNTDGTTSAGSLTLSVISGWCSNASCSSSWKYRRKITFDNTTATLGVTSEALTNFPVLVKLTSSNIDYSQTQDSGQDIRFVDPDGTALSYEIESWDEAGSSYVWVKVPSIDINSNTDYIYVYYGNSGASDAQTASSVWDSNYKMVHHFNSNYNDSTSNTFNGTNSGTSLATGKVANAVSNSSNSNSITISDSAGWETGSNGFTVEFWAKHSSSFSDAYSIPWDSWTDSKGIQIGLMADKKAYVFINSSAPYLNGSGTAVSDVTQWHKYVYVYVPSTSVKMYVDGTQYASITSSIASSVTAVTRDLKLVGGYYSGSGYTFKGLFDEHRFSATARSAAWIAADYFSQNDAFNSFGSQEGRYESSGTITSNIFDTTQPSAWETLSYTSSGSTVTVKARTSNDSGMSGATAFSSCTAITSGDDISSNGCVTDGHRYIQYQIGLSTADTASTPTFSDVSILYGAYDTTAPTTNASSIAMSTASSGGRSISSNGWNSAASPYFSWTAGADNSGGSGLLGYCLYLGTDSSGNPSTSKGLLGTSPVSTSGSTCQFIVSGTNLDLSTSGYLGSTLASGTTYYLNVKAIDSAYNIFSGSSAQFQFRHDVTAPTNVTAICTPGGSFSNVADMSFSWTTTTCATAASDAASGLLGYQYQINSTAGTWLGSTTDATCGINYIPAATFSRTLTAEQDEDSIVAGANTIYFRTVDTACNTSSDATIRTGSLSYGGDAPTFGGSDSVTVSPSTSTSNSFTFSWPEASPASGQTITNYYYMINTSPPSALSTITSNTSTYIDNETSRTVSAAAVSGAVKGSNTIYVVAVDDDDNYSPSNVITGSFTLNSTVPDPPTNLSVSDASVKSASLWRASLAWGVPAYKGTGSLTYKIQRSTNSTTWSDVTTTSGTAYVDTVSESQQYYWRVCSYDTSSESTASPSCASGVTLTPKGTYSEAPSLSSGPTVGSITTKKAKITWSTSRASDSKVQYGTSSGDYLDEEPSNSTQTTDHSIVLTNLSPGTTYYYKTKWTDEDGNTGTSEEKSFSTDAAPTVTDPKAKSIGLTSTVLEYTVTGASEVKIYYGKTTSFGGIKEVSTSTSESTYTTELVGLDDGSKYYYKINVFDSEDVEYEGSTLAFETLPRPKISNVRVQQVAKTAQSTLLVTWQTNTEVSSIITYYPEGNAGKARDEVNVALLKGEHQMILRGLLPQTVYTLLVKGRDKIGNEATADSQKVTTATDTRPPQISDLKVEGSTIPLTSSAGQEQQAQLIVSWNTDEPSSSQVEFGEGTGTSYAQKTQQDSNFTNNHLVIISGLTPSKVYHLRAISKDSAANAGTSIDVVSIAPKGTENALNLVIQNLQQVFGFIGGLQK